LAGDSLGSINRTWRSRAVGVVAPVDVEPTEIGTVIGVEMGEQHRGDVVKVGVLL
jgi:hypothetical protein